MKIIFFAYIWIDNICSTTFSDAVKDDNNTRTVIIIVVVGSFIMVLGLVCIFRRKRNQRATTGGLLSKVHAMTFCFDDL